MRAWFWYFWIVLSDLFDEYHEWLVSLILLGVLVFCAVSMTGCAHIPRITLPSGTKVEAPKDVGKPAEVTEGTERTGFRIPANSKVSVIRKEALPSTGYLAPAVTEYSFELPEPTDFLSEAKRIAANTGTIDTTVAEKRIDAQERRPLLYCAIGAVVVGLGLMYVRFQALAVMSFIAGGVFFAAWKMSEISPWIGALFIVAAIVGFAFYKRAEWDANGDGIPDILQKK